MRIALTAIVGSLLVILFLWAGALGLANLVGMRGDAVVASHERGDPPSYDDWHSGYQAYLDAAKVHPLSGAYSDELGRLLELWAGSDARQGAPAEGLRLEALDYFRVAAGRRPTWPFSRIGIVRLKAKLGQIDAELMRNLRTASDLAPMMPGAQEPLMVLGLITWDLLDAQTRDVVTGIIDRNLLLNPRQAIAQAIDFRRTDLIEGRLGADPALGRLYREMMQSSRER